MIVINFKAYSEATGKKARQLAEACEKARKETGERIVISPSNSDLLRAEHLDLEIFSQHIDPVNPGSHTGSVTVKEVKSAGATGTLLNHSERRLDEETLEKSIEISDDKGITTVVCAQNPDECEDFSSYSPDYIAYEPPELIGGDVSVSQSKPEVIEEAVKRSSVPVLTGAGIKNMEDVEKSMRHGCEGVLVASGVVKAKKPHEEILELAEGLK